MALVDPNRIKASIAQDKVVNRPGGIMQPKFNLGKVEEPSIFNFGYWREEKAPLLAAWMKMDPKEQDRPDPGLTFGNLAPFKPMEDAFPRTSVGFPKDEPKAITTFSPEDGDLVGRFDGQRGYVGTDTSAAVADALIGNSVVAPVAKESIGLMSRGTEQAKWANASAPDGADKINKAIGKQLVQGAQEDSGDKVSEGLLERKMENRIKELEGLKTKAYKPKADEEHWTIGIGDYGSHVSKDQVITKQEAWDRFREVTLPAKVAVAKRLFTNYDNISDDLKIELVQGIFRGDFKSTHDSVRLINEGKYAEAAVEFLDNQNYRDALVPSNNIGGVATRMEAVRDALLAEAE